MIQRCQNNAMGRLYNAVYGISDQTKFFYDVRGREVQSRKMVDGVEYIVARTFDDLDRLKTVSYPQGYVARYGYDDAGQMKTLSLDTTSSAVTASPERPAAPSITTMTPGNAQVSLVWSAVNYATGYKVKYGTSSGNFSQTIDVGNVTSKTVAGLTNGVTYYFLAVAYNSYGDGPASAERTATPSLKQLRCRLIPNLLRKLVML